MGTAVGVRSRRRVRIRRILIGVVVLLVVVGIATFGFAEGLSPQRVADDVLALSSPVLIGFPAVLILLAVGIPASAWEWKRVARARVSLRRQRRIEELRPLADLLHLTPETLDRVQASTLQNIARSEDFEELMAKVLAARGYRDVKAVGQTGDHGIDIVGKTPDGKQVIVAQCKRYAAGNNISEPTVRDFLGASYDFSVQHRAPVALFLATSGYTEAARTYAGPHEHPAKSYQISLLLYDGEQLAQMVRELAVR